MEAYNTPLKNTMEPLDFTSEEKKAASSSSEPLLLDLSCKKEVSPSSQQGTSWNSRQNSLTSNEKQLQGSLFPGSRQRSPIESRIFDTRFFAMTPPSESDSPKKMKYESIDNYFNALGKKPINQLGGLPMLPTTLPMPQQFASNNSVALPMAGTSATTSSTATPYENDAEMTFDMGKKMPRPFKAYPKDPLSLSMGSAEMMYNQNSNDAYSEFRKRMLESVKKTNEGTNIKMKRVTKSPTLPTSTVDEKDAAYWERRRKNNEAAKRSRDARRAKEDEIAIRAAFLERENMQLRFELAALKDEMAKLRSMMYSS